MTLLNISYSHTRETASDSYLDLVNKIPLRPIRSERDHQKAIEILSEMASLSSMTQEQSDYFDVLSDIVEKYESQKWAVDTSNISKTEFLQFLMDNSGMTASDLGRVLGDRSLGNKILKGQRNLNRNYIAKLSAHFKVSPELFF